VSQTILVASLSEQIAVVTDEKDRAVEFEEVFFQPFDGGEIEVVGGFIEKQEIGFADE